MIDVNPVTIGIQDLTIAVRISYFYSQRLKCLIYQSIHLFQGTQKPYSSTCFTSDECSTAQSLYCSTTGYLCNCPQSLSGYKCDCPNVKYYNYTANKCGNYQPHFQTVEHLTVLIQSSFKQLIGQLLMEHV